MNGDDVPTSNIRKLWVYIECNGNQHLLVDLPLSDYDLIDTVIQYNLRPDEIVLCELKKFWYSSHDTNQTLWNQTVQTR